MVFFSYLFVLILATAHQAFSKEASLIIHSERPLQAESSYEALQPFETPISGFFIRSHHDVPVVDFENHKIRIHGLVEHPIEMNVSELRKMPQKNFYAVLECSGNKRGFQIPSAGGIQWSEGAVGNAQWEGVSLFSLLEKAKPKKEAKFITVRGADKPALPTTPEFIRSIPLSKAMQPDTLLALKMNREDLPLLHGGPVRLVLPHWYAQNWIKWITEIELTAEEDSGFYMKKAYRMPKKSLKPGEAWNSEDGIPIGELLVQSLIVYPTPQEIVPKGKVVVKGKAFSGTGSITRVEVSWNKGRNWKKATLLPAHPMGGWQEFEFETEALNLGKYEFLSRATDEKGNIQPMTHSWNPPGYLRNAVTGVSFWVVDSKEYEGYEVYRNQCLICHSEGLIASQRFDKKGWIKLITKMKSFGAAIDKEDEEKLLYFLQNLKKRKLGTPQFSSYEIQKTKYQLPEGTGKDSSGIESLYQSNCAQCHGEQGHGGMGPRLRGRLVPKELFIQAVTKGRNRMPSFENSITPEQVHALWSYLQKP